MRPKTQMVTRLDYCQYLLVSQINYTLTNFADYSQKFSHDAPNRYLMEAGYSRAVLLRFLPAFTQSQAWPCPTPARMGSRFSLSAWGASGIGRGGAVEATPAELGGRFLFEYKNHERLSLMAWTLQVIGSRGSGEKGPAAKKTRRIPAALLLKQLKRQGI